jgi:PAS domain-containing protein
MKHCSGPFPFRFFFKGSDGRCLGCNHAFAQMMGVSAEEFRAKTDAESGPNKRVDENCQKNLGLLNRPEQQVCELEIKDKHEGRAHGHFEQKRIP